MTVLVDDLGIADEIGYTVDGEVTHSGGAGVSVQRPNLGGQVHSGSDSGS